LTLKRFLLNAVEIYIARICRFNIRSMKLRDKTVRNSAYFL